MSSYLRETGGGGSPYLRSGSVSGSSYLRDSRGGGGSGPHKKAKPHGVSGFFRNLEEGAKSTAAGFGPGVYHALKLAEEDARKDLSHPLRNSPLYGMVTGKKHKSFSHIVFDPGEKLAPVAGEYRKKYISRDVGKHIYDDPFGTFLDAAALATMGAGAAARGGELAARAGMISDTSRLARLREARELTVPNLAKQAGQKGEDVILKKSSTNPLIRGRQVAVNKALNAAPAQIPLVGSQARLARVVSRTAKRTGQALEHKGAEFKQAFSRLDDTHKAVWHLRARQLDPEGYKTLLEEGAIDDPLGTGDAMLKRLDDEKLKSLYAKGSKKLDHALGLGEELSHLMSHEKIIRGQLDELTAAESPYRAQRLMHGAVIIGKKDVVEAGPSARTAAQMAYVDRLQGAYDRGVKRVTKAQERLLSDEAAKYLKGGPVRSAPERVRALTVDEARAELEALDSQYEKFLDGYAGNKKTRPKLTPEEQAMQRGLNTDTGKYKKQQSGRTKSGRPSGASGYKIKEIPKTLNEQKRAEIEAELFRVARAHPDSPGGQAFLRVSERADELRAKIGAHEEQSLGPAGDGGAAAIEKIKADPASWDYHTGRPQLTYRAVKAMEAARRGDEAPVSFGTKVLPPKVRAPAKPLRGDVTDFSPQPLGLKVLTHDQRLLTPKGGGRLERLGSTLSTQKDRLEQMHAADARRLARKGGPKPRGVMDQPGHSIEEIAQRLADEGKQQPFHVPDTAEGERRFRDRKIWRSTQTSPPGPAGSTRQNMGTLLRRGMINLHGDSLSAEFGRFARHVQRTDIHGALLEQAAKVPETGLPKGYRYMKVASGSKGAPYTEGAAAELKDALASSEDRGSLLERFTTKNGDDERIAVDAEGHKLMIPDRVATLLEDGSKSQSSMVKHILYEKPTTVWKYAVLGLRPAYLINNVLSQHILGAMQMAPGRHGVEAYLNNLIPGARLGKLSEHAMEDVFPEQAHGSFAESQGGTKTGRAARVAYQGVMPATLRVENWLRKLMIEGWAKSEPEIIKAMAENGGSIDDALRQVKRTHPHVIDDISQKVDHAQGNYRTYSSAEQKLRAVIPFYGWDRHVVQSTYRLLAEHPIQAAAGAAIGRRGHEITEKDFGALPDYLQNLVKIHLPTFMHPAPGRTAGLSTKAISPWESDIALAEFAAALTHGKSGAHTEEVSNLSPFISGALEQLTGRSPLTGAKSKDNLNFGYGNVPIRVALNLPQARLIEQIFGKHPLGKQAPNPATLQDWRTQLASIIGVPTKQLDLPRQHQIAENQKLR